MEALSAAASILAVLDTAGDICLRLYSLSKQINDASSTITFLATEVSLISTFLRRLQSLVENPQTNVSQDIFSHTGLDLISQSMQNCNHAFEGLSTKLDKARKQLKKTDKSTAKPKIKFRLLEKAKWPFLRSGIERLRTDLRDAKTTLVLVLQLGTFVSNKRNVTDAAPSQSRNTLDTESMIETIEAIYEEHTGHASVSKGHSIGPNSEVQAKSMKGGTYDHSEFPEEIEDFSILESRSKQIIETFSRTQRPEPIDYNSIDAISFQLRPAVEDLHEMVQLSWHHQVARLPSNQLQSFVHQKDMMRDTFMGLDAEEQLAINNYMRYLGRDACMVSVKRTFCELIVRGIVVKDIPGVQALILNRLGGYSNAQDAMSSSRRQVADWNDRQYLPQGAYPLPATAPRYNASEVGGLDRGPPPFAGEHEPAFANDPLRVRWADMSEKIERGETSVGTSRKRKAKAIEEDTDDSSHSRSRSPGPPSSTGRRRQQEARSPESTQEEGLPPPPGGPPGSTGSRNVDYLLQRYTNYFSM